MKIFLNHSLEKLVLAEEKNRKLREVVKKLEEEKIDMELYFADIVHDH